MHLDEPIGELPPGDGQDCDSGQAASSRRFLATAGALSLCILLTGLHAQGSPVLEESFDGPSTRWQAVETKDPMRLLGHGLVEDADRPGSQVERIALEAAGGTSIHFSYPVGRAPVIDELQASVWLRSNRPGTILAARIVLPRSIDPETGTAHTLLVHGQRYEHTTSWQHLRLAGVPMLVKRYARVLRLDSRSPVDDREAYVESLMLVIPGGSGGTEVRTDDLTLDGILLTGEGLQPDRANEPPAVVTVGWTADNGPANGRGPQRLPSRQGRSRLR